MVANRPIGERVLTFSWMTARSAPAEFKRSARSMASFVLRANLDSE
jgi:hypothetical protein